MRGCRRGEPRPQTRAQSAGVGGAEVRTPGYGGQKPRNHDKEEQSGLRKRMTRHVSAGIQKSPDTRPELEKVTSQTNVRV